MKRKRTDKRYKRAPKFKRSFKLPVYRLLPVGTKEVQGKFQYRVAKSDTERFYYCDHCKGWISDVPHKELVTEGRLGAAFICLRCGREIAFHGRDNPRSPQGVLQ